jgi:DNA polymerase III subunit delta'
LNPQDLPWLEAQKDQVRGAWDAQRLAPAFLIREARGAGGEVLALWMAQFVLCTDRGRAPCGECAACRQVKNGWHADLLCVRPIEDSKQIRVEQVRDLCAELSLTSYQGGYKVAIVSPADALNRNAANAFLKTLEEPTPRTLLILVATQPSRLPVTVLSRCQRLLVRAPSRAQALEWLQATRASADWEAALETLGDAPLIAAETDPRALAEMTRETRRVLEETCSGRADPAASAERWARTDLALRLMCIENWLTDRIRGHFTGADFSVEGSAGVHLQRRAQTPSIGRFFILVDAVRELKATLDASFNRALALESLLRQLTPGTNGARGP